MNIVTDQDDAIWELFKPFLSWHNDMFNTGFQYRQMTSFNCSKIFRGKQGAKNSLHTDKSPLE